MRVPTSSGSRRPDPGSTPLGRTLGLVAPTPAEYRLLGSNEAFLATLRAATSGRAIETAAQPWTHDLATTDIYTDLWPSLLILALLLWPLDIALRRVSMGRRELADARRWLAGGWRRRGGVAPRPVEVAGMLAARDRAAGSSARAAILRGDVAAERRSGRRPGAGHRSGSPGQRRASPRPLAPPGRKAHAASSPADAPRRRQPRDRDRSAPAAPAEEATDTLTRLREAKRKKRGG